MRIEDSLQLAAGSFNIDTVVLPPANPIGFDLTFDSSRPPATYHATWRFVAFDMNNNNVGCRDLPVTFTIQ